MDQIAGRLDRLRYLFGRDYAKRPNAEFAIALAAELDWKTGYANIDSKSVPSLSSVVHRGFIGKTPAVLFATDFSGSALPVHEIASYAYQSSIEWGLITNRSQTVVFNSHWSKNRDWFQVPVEWDRQPALADLLSAFTPEGIQNGYLDVKARQFAQEDDRLLPVDDALVNLLDRWRDEAFETASSEQGIDDAVQTLFSQLFILRAIEDRKLAPGLSPLSTVIEAGVADLDELARLFFEARTEVQSDLFEEQPFLRLPIPVVTGIIHDLYTPTKSPIANFRYNFAWITADILGRAYEKYLSSIIVARNRSQRQLSMFGDTFREAKRVSIRKEGGVYYTPNYVVQYLTKRCLEQFFLRYPFAATGDVASYRLPQILDPACGSGSFLTSAVDALITRLKRVKPRENWGRRLVEGKCISGIDKDPRAVRLAQLSVWLRLAEEANPLPLPSLKQAIRTGDSLTDDPWKGLPDTFDVALGNPPFISMVAIENREFLERKYSVATGRFDLAYVFLELCNSKMKGNGLLGMVVPNRLFTSRDADSTRSLLATNFDLLTVVDFASNPVFADAHTYIGLLVAEKVPTVAVQPRRHLRYIKVRSIPERFPEWMLECADASGHDFQNSHVTVFSSVQPPADGFWYFLSPSRRAIRVALEQDSTPLGNLAEIRQGIKTGANDIFVVEVLSRSDRRWRVRNGVGDQGWLEPTVLHPVVYGSDIQCYDLVQASRYLIYPYREGHVIRPDELRTEFPLLQKYFDDNRAALVARRNIAERGKLWYELAEKRSLSWLSAAKLLSRELARESSFAIDQSGTTFLIGGIVVRPAEETLLEPLLAYLNSRLVTEYIAERSPEFGSAFLKIERQVLERLPVPNQLQGAGARSQLAERASVIINRESREDEEAPKIETQIDAIVSEMIGESRFVRPGKPMPEWLAQAVILDGQGDTPRAMDAVYNGFDRLMTNGQFELVDELLGQLPLERLSLALLIGALGITLPAASHFPMRQHVFDRAGRSARR